MIWPAPKNRRNRSERRRWQWPRVNWQRWAMPAAACVAVVAIVGTVISLLDQPIRNVGVSGRFQRVSPADVERAVKETIRKAGLVSINLGEVRQAIDALPWVDTVTVQRAWPKGLQVVVVEQIPAARWGEDGLLNTRGELFVAHTQHIPPELAALSGPPGKENEVAQRYLAAQGRLVQAGLRLTALNLDARGAWEMKLSNGVTVRLGRRQVDERFDTFMRSALRLVAQRAEEMTYVDMRYSNGFAIGWRDRRRAATRGGSDSV
jgi:cell division protein FtsQ